MLVSKRALMQTSSLWAKNVPNSFEVFFEVQFFVGRTSTVDNYVANLRLFWA